MLDASERFVDDLIVNTNKTRNGKENSIQSLFNLSGSPLHELRAFLYRAVKDPLHRSSIAAQRAFDNILLGYSGRTR